MKTKLFLILVFVACAGITGFSQESRPKQTKEEQRIAIQQPPEALLTTKEFVFTGLDAYPTDYRTVNLSGRQNFVKFHPELIESSMPYFGRANSSVACASISDAGLKFEGKPEEYTFEKKKRSYQFSGSATLTIISNSRSPISYNVYITAPAASDKKK